MTPAQKKLREFRERQSRERGRMAELALVDELTEEQRSELDAIEKGTPDLERQLRAATVAVEQEEQRQQTVEHPDAEQRERLELRGRLMAEAERSLADEAGGPLANPLAVPQDGGDGGADDPLAALKADIRTARGKALLVETAAAGWGEGRTVAPQRDWQAARLGPMLPDSMVKVAEGAFSRVLAACGVPPSLFLDSDGTSQREAVRRWHLNTVLPLARLVEAELTEKLEAEFKLQFGTYALDMVSRSQVVAKLTAVGVALPVALAAVGLEGEA